MRYMVYVILGLLAIFLFFFCLYLCKKNQDLSNKIKELQACIELERNNRDIASVKFLSSNKVPMKEISKEIEDAINECEKRKSKKDSRKDSYEEDRIDKILNSSISSNKDPFCHAYEKNMLNKTPNTLSSVEICNSDTCYKRSKKGVDVVMNEVDSKVNLNDFIRRGSNTISLEEEVVPTKKKNISFVEEISRQLSEQLGPQTIELTDYEKEQEETAIISYQELLKVKEQLYEENVAKENEEFLNDLKALRNNLG